MDWTRLLTQQLQEFMKEEGITPLNIHEKLTGEVLKRFLEKFAGTADPVQLRKQLADAPGAAGFFISLMLAMPVEGRLATLLVLSEVMKAAGLPIPTSARTAVIAAFGAMGEAGVTDADVRRYRSRVLSYFNSSAIPAESVPVPIEPITGASAVPTPKDTNMSPLINPLCLTWPVTPVAVEQPGFHVFAVPGVIHQDFGPSASAQTPETVAASTTQNPLPGSAEPPPSGGDPVVPPSNPPEPVTVNNVPVTPPSGGGGAIPPSTGLTPRREGPDGNRWRYLDFIINDVLPLRENETLTLPDGQLKYRFGLAWVQEHLGEDSAFGKQAREAFSLLPEMTELERATLEPHLVVLRRVHAPKSTVTKAERNLATVPVNDAIHLSHAWDVRIRVIAQANAWFWRRWFLFGLADLADDKNDDEFREWRNGILKIFGFGSATTTAVIAIGALMLGRKAYNWLTKKPEAITSTTSGTGGGGGNSGGTSPGSTPAKEPTPFVTVLGWFLIVVCLIMVIPWIASWFVEGMSIRALMVTAPIVTIWCAKYLPFIHDPWVWPRESVVLNDDTNALVKGRVDVKSRIFEAINERNLKLLLVTPGIWRRLLLKIALGAVLIGGIIMNFVFIFTGDSHIAQASITVGILAAGFFLDLAQLFNAYFTFSEIADMLKPVFRPALKLIVGVIVVGLGSELLFPGIGQVGLLAKVQSTTRAWAPVSKEMVKTGFLTAPVGDLWFRSEPVTKPLIASVSGTCASRDRMEARMAGYCSNAQTKNDGRCKCE